MRDHIGGYSFSWQQPYTYNMSLNPAYQVSAMNELARLDFLEEQIQQMTHYPDAEKIINRILKSK